MRDVLPPVLLVLLMSASCSGRTDLGVVYDGPCVDQVFTTDPSVGGFAVDKDYVFFSSTRSESTEANNVQIWQAHGRYVAPFVSGVGAYSMTVDSAHVFLIGGNVSGLGVYSIDRINGSVEMVTDDVGGRHLSADDRAVYFAGIKDQDPKVTSPFVRLDKTSHVMQTIFDCGRDSPCP